jgi:hypothetical protein
MTVTEEGLYRMSGSKEDITNAHRDINKGTEHCHHAVTLMMAKVEWNAWLGAGKTVDLAAMAAKSAHTVTGLLKLYFRELKPEPLMTFNLYECLLAGTARRVAVCRVRVCVCACVRACVRAKLIN